MINGRCGAKVVALGLTLLSALAAGCDDGGEPSSPREKVGAVREALESPNGMVDGTTVADLNELNAQIAATSAVFAATRYANTSSGECFSGELTDGSVDLACATKDLPEEQQLTGKITIHGEGEAGLTSVEVYAELTYENVCDATRCVDGVVASETLVENDAVTSATAVSFDVKEGSKTLHVFWGSDFKVEEGSVTAKIAIWDSLDHSYVMESSVTAEGVTFTLTGANGTFSCEATAEGGSCTGDGQIEF